MSLAAARDAYTSGLNIVAVVCALVAATTAVIAVTALRGVGSPQGGPAPDTPGQASARTAEGDDPRAVPKY
ncbi:hypothetical protein [Streptomyces cyaneofuscatus]|uniref:hypothetical protein n=1 Tax=Streptomyces cyaneofuscatus TaxID=66883 RepID=UPI0037B57F8E